MSKENNDCFAPPLIESVPRRTFVEPPSKFSARTPRPYLTKTWANSLESLKKGSLNGLYVSNHFPYSANGVDTSLQEVSLSEETLDHSVVHLRSYSGTFFEDKFIDRHWCKVLYKKELKRCERVMKPVFKTLFRLYLIKTRSAFSRLYGHMLQKREQMRRAGENLFQRRRAMMHFVYARLDRAFSSWKNYYKANVERRLRINLIVSKYIFKLKAHRFRKWKTFAAWETSRVSKAIMSTLAATNKRSNSAEIDILSANFKNWKDFCHLKKRREKIRLGIWKMTIFLKSVTWKTWRSANAYTRLIEKSKVRALRKSLKILEQNVQNEIAKFNGIVRGKKRYRRRTLLYIFMKVKRNVKLSKDRRNALTRISNMYARRLVSLHMNKWKNCYQQMNPFHTQNSQGEYDLENSSWLEQYISSAKRAAEEYFLYASQLQRQHNGTRE